MTDAEKFDEIETILWNYSQIDGSHHKAWCLDQIARILWGQEYDKNIREYEYGVVHEETGEDMFSEEKQYEWDEGIAP